MQLVALVFTDRTRRICSVQEAERLCSDPNTSGKIVDALTEDAALQERLRRLIDRN